MLLGCRLLFIFESRGYQSKQASPKAGLAVSNKYAVRDFLQKSRRARTERAKRLQVKRAQVKPISELRIFALLTILNQLGDVTSRCRRFMYVRIRGRARVQLPRPMTSPFPSIKSALWPQRGVCFLWWKAHWLQSRRNLSLSQSAFDARVRSLYRSCRPVPRLQDRALSPSIQRWAANAHRQKGHVGSEPQSHGSKRAASERLVSSIAEESQTKDTLFAESILIKVRPPLLVSTF